MVKDVPGHYIAYTIAELEELFRDEVTGKSWRFVHEAKKSGKTKAALGQNPTHSPKPEKENAAALETLGMSIEDALHIWAKEGKPVVHLGPGENCFDLERLLSQVHVKPKHLLAVSKWLMKRSQNMEAQGQ